MTIQFSKQPLPVKDRKDASKRSSICRYCRLEQPHSHGMHSPPMLTIVSLWGKGRANPRMGYRRMVIAEGVRWPDGLIWIRWMDGAESGGSVEVFPSIRVLQAKYGAHYEVIGREW